MSTMTLSEQVDRLVAECQRLRVKSRNDDETIKMLKGQYDGLVAQVKNIREEAAKEVEHARSVAAADVQDMEIELDQAKLAYREIESILNQTSVLLVQGLAGRLVGTTPASEKPISGNAGAVEDPRLPRVGLVR